MLSLSEMVSTIRERGVILLDGGLATELEKRGHDLNHQLWSARLLLDNPEEIKAVHQSYLEAGSDCITTASYQASIPGLVDAGLTPHEASGVIAKSVSIARDVVADWASRPNKGDPMPWVAASIGSYGAFLADGSEFRGNFGVSDRQLYDFHAPRLEVICNAEPDLLAIETIPCQQEARVLRALLDEFADVVAWISFSCADEENICDGSSLSQTATIFSDCQQVVAIGVNCTAPALVKPLIDQIRMGAPDKHVVVYPNSGQTFDATTRTWQGISDASDFGAMARQWRNAGASLIGGCCQTGPDHIRCIKRALDDLAV